MANLAVWNTILSIHLSVRPAINLNALKNLQFPMLKNMQHAALRRIPGSSKDVLRGALVLLIKSTSSNPETAYPHALISATNRLAECLPCCIPSYSIPITSRHSLSLPDPLSKGRMSEKANKSQDHCQSLNPVTQTNTGTDIDAHTRQENPFTSSKPPGPYIRSMPSISLSTRVMNQ